MQREDSQADQVSQARRRRSSSFSCNALPWSCTGPSGSAFSSTSYPNALENSGESPPMRACFADAIEDDGTPLLSLSDEVNSSSPTAFSTAPTSSFVPSSSDPFDEPYPQRRHNFFSLDDVLLKPLQELIAPYIPIEDDFYRPVTMLPHDEYEPGAIFALKIEFGSRYNDRIHDALLLLNSLRQRKIYMLPSIAALPHGGIPFRKLCTIRNLRKDHLNNLTVLFVSCYSGSKHIWSTIQQLSDILLNVTLLVVQASYGRLKDEWFVFDLRRSDDRIPAIANAILKALSKEFLKADGELLQQYADAEGNEVVLVEAIVPVRRSVMPLFNANIAHPLCRFHWSFNVDKKTELYKNAPSSADRLICLTGRGLLPLEQYPKLRSLVYRGKGLPHGFHHSLLSCLYWDIDKTLYSDISLEDLPNLQCLTMKDENGFLGSHRLVLGNNHMLWRLLLTGFSNSVIDMGNMSVDLDFVCLRDVQANIIGTEKMTIRELEIHDCKQGDLLQRLGERAGKCFFKLKNLDDRVEKRFVPLHERNLMVQYPPMMLSNMENVRLVLEECNILNQKSISVFPFPGRFDHLRWLDLSKCGLIFAPNLFPKLQYLKLFECDLMFSMNGLNDSWNLHDNRHAFRCLEVLEMGSCKGQIQTRLFYPGISHNISTQRYLLRAPMLQRLVLYGRTGTEKIWIDQISCPSLNSFEWSGQDYWFLPFDIYEQQSPLFPNLQELKLKRLSNFEQESYSLAHRLCISQVTILSLTESAAMNELFDTVLSCRFAEFSLNVIHSSAKNSPFEQHHFQEEYVALSHPCRIPVMPNIELLVIGGVVIQSRLIEEAKLLQYPVDSPKVNCLPTTGELEQKSDSDGE